MLNRCWSCKEAEGPLCTWCKHLIKVSENYSHPKEFEGLIGASEPGRGLNNLTFRHNKRRGFSSARILG